MKKYVFLTFGIGGIGGGQIYLYRKGRYLRNRGYDVSYIYYLYDTIKIQQFNEFVNKRIVEISKPSFYFSSRIQDKILNTIIESCRLNGNTEVIIESSNIIFGTWGESLAQKVNGKHISYLLAEQNLISDGVLLDFLNFKSDRRELSGISDITEKLFVGSEFDYKDINVLKLKANCVSEIEDYNVEAISKIENDKIVISIIGRLDKTYLIPTLLKLKDYVGFEQNQGKRFVIILVGDTTDMLLKKHISCLFDDVKNTELLITGSLFPIPKLLLTRTNVFIATSGSARLTANMGCFTISLDAQDNLPIGLMGYTTNETMFRGNEDAPCLYDLLDDILVRNKYKRNLYPEQVNNDNGYEDHMEFINNSYHGKDYYHFPSLSFWNKNRIGAFAFNIKRLVNKVFGDKLYAKIAQVSNQR